LFDWAPPKWLAWTVMALGLAVMAAVLAALHRTRRGRRRGGGSGDGLDGWRAGSRQWASLADVAELVCDPGTAGRLSLGWFDRRRHLGAARNRSVMVLAPTGAGKTPRVVVPAVLRHRGPAVVASVKSDVLALTLAARERLGPVWVFDPAEETGFPACRWSPLLDVTDFAGAERAASFLCESARAGDSRGIEGQVFWDSLARRCVAPMLFAAALTGRTMRDVARWIQLDDGEATVSELLTGLGDVDALSGWQGHLRQATRLKSDVLSTAATILEVWARASVARAVDVAADDPDRPVLDLDRLVDGSGGTLYLVAPASDQQIFLPVFSVLVNTVLRRVELVASRRRLPPDPPLLLALDEAGNIAPLRRLDQVASKGANEGVLLLTVWQDRAQVDAIYGPDRARVIAANHWAEILMPGIKDQRTLVEMSEAIGRDWHPQTTVTWSGGRKSTSVSDQLMDVAPVSFLRSLAPDEAIVLSGRHPAIRVRLPGWFEDPQLRAMVDPEVAAAFDRQFARPQPGRGRRGGRR
jgi:type IV secretory pathway TraG/TraD family ATPase VirD4